MSLLKRLQELLGGGGRRRAGPVGDSYVTFKFEKFKDVLKCNNHALELIADVGVKLSGDYVFDSHYVETAFVALSDAVLKSVHALNTVCENCYRDLYGTYDRITEHIRRIVDQREDREGPAFLKLEDITRFSYAIVGGKNRHLAQIARDLHLPVPEGFVITTRAYHDIIDFNGLRDTLDTFESLVAGGDAPPESLEAARTTLQNGLLHAKVPPPLIKALDTHLQHLRDACGQAPMRLAVRSSAREEDMDFSFAGQYKTELGVPADTAEILEAYRKVTASLFESHAVQYRCTVLQGEGQISIAVGCQKMIDAVASGVLYTDNPSQPGGDTLLIACAWGQGEAVVSGQIPTDTFTVKKFGDLEIIQRQIAVKSRGLFAKSRRGGLEYRPIPKADQKRACIRDDQVRSLARMALRLENYFKLPQDVEWVVDSSERIYILQSRPLLLKKEAQRGDALPGLLEKYEILIRDRGKIAQQGIGAGPVKVVRSTADLDDLPEGTVVVSPRDMSSLALVMDKVAAIVTEVGTPVSHMATICREFGVPCLVNVDGILDCVKEGMEVTVDVEDNRIYKGRVPELLTYRASSSLNVFQTPAFRLLRRFLHAVASLNLVDPLLEDFTLNKCETYHDILRYVHEKAVLEMINLGRDEKRLLQSHHKKTLELDIPTGIIVIDMGGGIKDNAPDSRIGLNDVACIPFKALLEGMLYPGVWHREAMNVGFRDMVTSIVNAPADSLSGQYSGHNIGILTAEYVNLSLRFGYHFNIVDAFCSDTVRNNHFYFRFVGGATDISKRSRRARMIAEILEAFNLNVQTRGDVVTSRSGNMPRGEMEHTLNILGRLIGFTRQLDVHMDNDHVVHRYVKAFLDGNYGVVHSDGAASSA